MGCDMMRLSVPELCSELMASKPSPIPSNGPRKPMNTWNGGNVPSDCVNNFKNRKGSTALLDFESSATKFVMDVYNDAKHVNKIRNNSTLKRQLRTWSAISF